MKTTSMEQLYFARESSEHIKSCIDRI